MTFFSVVDYSETGSRALRSSASRIENLGKWPVPRLALFVNNHRVGRWIRHDDDDSSRSLDRMVGMTGDDEAMQCVVVASRMIV